jgi:anthranilate 1,2-dioxygenase small subunit
MDFLAMNPLERRFAVDDLLARYARCIDDDQLEQWPSFFTEHARYIVRSQENASRGLPTAAMYCDSRAMLVDRVVALRNANIYESHRYRHLISCTVLEDISAEALTAVSNYVVFRTRTNGATDIFSAGGYRDRIVLDGESFRFAEKLVTFDTDRIDTLLVTPL